MSKPVDIEAAKIAVEKIKLDVENMRKDSKPNDLIPAELLFVLMEAMIPVMEGMLEQLNEKE